MEKLINEELSRQSNARSKSIDFERSSLMSYDQKLDSAPTKIVILKPVPDRIQDREESWTSSLDTLDERSSIEDFLEEVKERLKGELQGKTLKKGSVVRGSGIETPFSEKPSDPKQIAQHIAKHVRDSVTRDLGMNLLRSESTRSYRNELQFNGPDSPEFINRDSRRFQSERLEWSSDQNIERPRPQEHPQEAELQKFKKDFVAWQAQAARFRECSKIVENDSISNKWLAQKNLNKQKMALYANSRATETSKSAPCERSGLQHHIRRKHEANDMRKKKKERFNFKEKNSSFRNSFTLRRRLFSKKIQSMTESHCAEYGPVKDFMSGPTVTMNFGENSTEVPPSPASVCSSNIQEEFCRQAEYQYLSPISTPDVTIGEDNAMPKIFRDISSNLRVDSNRPEDVNIEQDPTESEIFDLEDQVEAYIRDLLVASGFYNGPSDNSLSGWDPFAKPISNSVFEKVEESYRKLAEENNEEVTIKDHNDKRVDRKMLLHLLNEALSILLRPPVTMSRFTRKFITSAMLSPLHGRKLLDSVWKIIRVYLYPPADCSYFSLDNMVAQDLESSYWFSLMDEETNSLRREVECLIIGELVEETLKDVLYF